MKVKLYFTSYPNGIGRGIQFSINIEVETLQNAHTVGSRMGNTLGWVLERTEEIHEKL